MALYPPVKNATYTARFPIFDGNGAFLSGATGISSSVAKDGAAFGASSNSVTENASSGVYSLVLTASEMNANQVEVKVTSTSGKPVYLLIHTQDVIAELAQATPSATPLLTDAIMLIYMMVRNKLTETAVLHSISNDAGTVICKGTVSDDGTTFIRDELVAGP